MVFAVPGDGESFVDDRKPRAKDDQITTQEETPTQFNILLNDEADRDDDDDDDNEDTIDPTSIDLNPETRPVDNSLTTEAGVFSVNDSGDLRFDPSENYFGNSRISYTVRNFRGEESNRANISVAVTNINDPPTITGQNPDPLQVAEDASLTVTFGNLVVSDPDSSYPTGFSISIGSGSNYTSSGNVITPSANYSGPLSIPVTVNDGTASSNEFILRVSVTAVNDVPVITAQNPNPITATEEQAFTISVTNLTISDADDTYPGDFSLLISSGANYSVSGNTVTPAPNYHGQLTIPVNVNDGTDTSAPFNVQVQVANVNDAPQITGQVPLTTGEDQALTLQFDDLVVQDSDNAYPTGFSINVSDGDNYSVTGTTITPDPNFTGTLNVTVTVSDGALTSTPFILSVSVSNSNDTPVITGQSPLSVDEDNSITVTLAHLTVTDHDNTYPNDFTLTLSPGTNYTLSGTTIIPAPDFSGTLTVPAVVNDGQASSASFPLSITVNAINDQPVITGQASLTTTENTPLTLALSDFTVTDPDNSYPTGFALAISPGANYNVSGTTITPVAGFSGTLSVNVSVNDGSTPSAAYAASVTVTAVNDPPVITGNNPVSVAEDNSLTIQLANLIVTDTDNAYPTGFSLTVLPGSDYVVTGNTVTASANFNGTLSVGVYVNDGTASSATYALPVTVSPVNDAPQITGQQSVATSEDQSITIELSHLLVTDPDHTSFTLTVFPGANYTVSGNTVTPAMDYRGILSVPVQVTDGELSSNVFQLQVAVADVNDTPIITGQTPLSTNEDTPVSISLANLIVLDPDNNYPSGFTLAISPGMNYTVAGNTITPAMDFNGTLNIGVTVNDGSSTSAPFVFQIQVGDANDPPVITGQSPLSTSEETPLTLNLGNLTVTDPDNAYPTGFTLQVAPGENYTVQDAVVTPAPDFVGTLTVAVRVNDGVNNSPNFNLSIQVNAVNDAPSFNAIANQSVLENGTPAVVRISGISKGPGEDDQELTFTAQSGNTAVISNPTITYSGGSSARLTYSLLPDASGVVTITVTAVDNGPSGAPHENTYTSTFQVNVVEVNKAPTLDDPADLTLPEDAALTSVNITGITSGAGETQTLSLEVTTDKPALFETLAVVYTSPQASGTIQVKPAPNAFGSATVTVRVVDNGSNTAPSINFVQQTFTITVQPINDLPVFTSTPVTVAAVNERYEYLVEFTDVETPNLTVVISNKPGWAALTAVSAGKFRLAGTPPSSAQGQTAITLQIIDGGEVASQQFTLIVNNRPLSSPVQVETTEDVAYTFKLSDFTSSYSDIDQHPLHSVVVVQLPPNGKLIVGDGMIKANDTIEAAIINQLQYMPNPNYDKPDVFFWKAFDGYHLSAEQASVDIAIRPVNDPPVITVPQDTLQFDVTGEPRLIASLFDIQDPDNDSLASAEIIITENHDPQFDQLILQGMGNVRGVYEPQSGRITLNGLAPISDYKQVMANIQYNYLNTLDPDLRMKKISYTASDGMVASEPAERLINLTYTFIELEIPSGFTPNGDAANDQWIITRPGGLDQLQGASIRVMNRRGVVVFESKGFDKPWDGTLNGEPLPADSYYFSIDLNLRSKKTYKGVVTILR
ncbi:MAG TPA: tandem-95 repeat protein [Chryseosolibacter sp.]